MKLRRSLAARAAVTVTAGALVLGSTVAGAWAQEESPEPENTSTELSRCLEVVQRTALAQPGVGFVVIHNGKRVYFCCPPCPSNFMRYPDAYLKRLAGIGQEPVPTP